RCVGCALPAGTNRPRRGHPLPALQPRRLRRPADRRLRRRSLTRRGLIRVHYPVGMADLVIRNANIVDGTGSPAYAGDIVVDGSVITSIEAPGAAPAGKREIDAAGQLVAPGWVDVHTH